MPGVPGEAAAGRYRERRKIREKGSITEEVSDQVAHIIK